MVVVATTAETTVEIPAMETLVRVTRAVETPVTEILATATRVMETQEMATVATTTAAMATVETVTVVTAKAATVMVEVEAEAETKAVELNLTFPTLNQTKVAMSTMPLVASRDRMAMVTHLAVNKVKIRAKARANMMAQATAKATTTANTTAQMHTAKAKAATLNPTAAAQAGTAMAGKSVPSVLPDTSDSLLDQLPLSSLLSLSRHEIPPPEE